MSRRHSFSTIDRLKRVAIQERRDGEERREDESSLNCMGHVLLEGKSHG